MSAADKLRALAGKKGILDVDRVNYQSYVADRVEFGHWTPEDVDEYRLAVAAIMQSGTDDDKQAAREFWALKAEENKTLAVGVNARIHASLQAERLEEAA